MSDSGLDAELWAVWQKSKPVALERVAVVRAALGDGAPDLNESARSASHKLAGSLGMFGLDEASGLAIELDSRIVAGALDDAQARAALVPMLDALHAAIEADR